MKIKSIEYTSIPGIAVITPEIYKDDRGYFFESFNKNDFSDLGLPTNFVQDNQAYSTRGILRGLHYQLKYPQGKLVQVLKGEVLDVAADIREGSPTFGKTTEVRLSETNNKIMYIPEGLAHGYLVLSDSALFHYKCTDVYHPNDEHGIYWNDNKLNINWKIENPILSIKDQKLPSLKQINKEHLPKYK